MRLLSLACGRPGSQIEDVEAAGGQEAAMQFPQNSLEESYRKRNRYKSCQENGLGQVEGLQDLGKEFFSCC